MAQLPSPLWSYLPRSEEELQEQRIKELMGLTDKPAPRGDLLPMPREEAEPLPPREYTPGEAFAKKLEEAKAKVAEVEAPQAVPQAKGSGGTSTETEKAQLNQQAQEIRALPIAPEDYEKMRLGVEGLGAYQEQARGISDLERMMMIGTDRPVQTDISPLLALADSETGSNLLRGYQRPEAAPSRLAQAVKYAQGLQDDRRALMQSMTQGIQSQAKGGTMMDVFKLMLERGGGQKYQDHSMKAGSGGPRGMGEDQKLIKLKELFDKETRGVAGKIHDANNLFLALQDGSWVGQAQFAPLIARISGAQPLSNFDIQRIKDPALIESIRNAWSKITAGKWAPKSRAEVEAFANIMQNRMSRIYGAAFEAYVGEKAKALGVDQKRARGFLGVDWLNEGHDAYKEWRANQKPPEIKAIEAKLKQGKASPEEMQKVKDWLKTKGAKK